MTLPANLSFLEATARATTSGTSDAAHRDAILACLKGDHWRGGAGWVGPRLPAENKLAQEFLNAVEAQFIPKNALLEIARRHTGAVIGRYPSIKLALAEAAGDPTEAQKKEMQAGESALTLHLDTVGALAKLQQFTRYLLIGQAEVRGYIPTGALRNGVVPQDDLLTSIKRIRMQVPKPGAAQIVDDEETGARYATYTSKNAEGKQTAEISYLTDDGLTVIKQARESSILAPTGDLAQKDNATDPVDMGGFLPIVQAFRDQFLTPTQLRNNMMVNFAKTAILRNAELAAVLERYGINILPPGEWVSDVQSPGGMRFQPSADFRPGGANATFYGPNYQPDSQGGFAAASGGQYGRFEPVSPAALIATKEDGYGDMLDEASQSHMKISGDATASGEARIQAMNDFKTSLYETATAIEAALTAYLSCVLHWAASLSGQPGRFKDYRVVIQCKITAAQPTVLERAQVIAERDGGLRSDEDAMNQIGIEDTDQMLAAVQADQEKKTAAGQAQAKLLGLALGDTG